MPTLLLIGGPTGVGKSTTLQHLRGLIPDSAILDADDVWRVSQELAVEESRPVAIGNVVSVMKGYFAAGCDTGILAWVFARPQLYQPIIDGLTDVVDSVKRVYLVSDPKTLESRLSARGELHKLEYAKSRLSLIESLPFPKIDTTNMTPAQVAQKIRDEVC